MGIHCTQSRALVFRFTKRKSKQTLGEKDKSSTQNLWQWQRQSNELRTLTFPLEILKSQLGKLYTIYIFAGSAADANPKFSICTNKKIISSVLCVIFFDFGRWHAQKKNLSKYFGWCKKLCRLHLKWHVFVTDSFQKLMTRKCRTLMLITFTECAAATNWMAFIRLMMASTGVTTYFRQRTNLKWIKCSAKWRQIYNRIKEMIHDSIDFFPIQMNINEIHLKRNRVRISFHRLRNAGHRINCFFSMANEWVNSFWC